MAAKTPQEQIQELKTLVVDYAKQETIDPIKSIGRYIGWALGGALAFGIGAVFLGIGALRFFQTSLPEALDGRGKSSWFPYMATILLLAAATGFVALKLTKEPKTATKDNT